jgi:hypothetical protein
MTLTVRVIGVPRSGTNLVKYLLETHTSLRCRFNHGWWKHAVIPALFEDGQPLRDGTPTIVLFREPLDQMQAFFRFSEKGRAAIYGDTPLPAFLRGPVRTDPPEGMSYWYPSPVAYWEQYYEAALRWDAPAKHFLSLEALQADPGVLQRLARAIAPDCIHREPFALPQGYVGRNGDAHVADGFGFEAVTSLAREQAEAQATRAAFGADDANLVSTAHVLAVYAELQEKAAR